VATEPEADEAGYSEEPEDSKRGFIDLQEVEVEDSLGQATRVSASRSLYRKMAVTISSLEQAIHPE